MNKNKHKVSFVEMDQHSHINNNRDSSAERLAMAEETLLQLKNALKNKNKDFGGILKNRPSPIEIDFEGDHK